MQKRLSEGTTSNILRKPDQLLSFILHVLDAASNILEVGAEQKTPIPDEDFLEGDSDDEAPDSEVIGPDDELVETAITLLLSILEGNVPKSPLIACAQRSFSGRNSYGTDLSYL